METLDETNKHSDSSNEIKEERLKALKGNYQKPMAFYFKFNQSRNGNCSDMASSPMGSCGSGDTYPGA